MRDLRRFEGTILASGHLVEAGVVEPVLPGLAGPPLRRVLLVHQRHHLVRPPILRSNHAGQASGLNFTILPTRPNLGFNDFWRRIIPVVDFRDSAVFRRVDGAMCQYAVSQNP